MRASTSALCLTAALVSWTSTARAADPHPAAPFVEYGAGVAGTVAGFVVGLPITVCAHSACSDAILPTLGILGTLGAASGVSIAGGAYGRGGSVPGAFLGSAAGMSLAALLLGVPTVLGGLNEQTRSFVLRGAIFGAFVLPSLGATLGYDSFRDTSRDTGVRAVALTSPRFALTTGAIPF